MISAPSADVVHHETQSRRVTFYPVAQLDEAVPLVVEGDEVGLPPELLQGLHDLARLTYRDARVIPAVDHEEGRTYQVCVVVG